MTLAIELKRRRPARDARPRGSISDCILDAVIETSDAASRRIVDALSEGAVDFVLTSGDGRLSAKVRLRLAGSGRTAHTIAGRSIFVDWSISAVENGRSRAMLSRTELRLLAALIDAGSRAMARSELIERVWPHDELPLEDRENALAVYVCCLRKRLAAVGVADAIATVRGLGYRLAQ